MTMLELRAACGFRMTHDVYRTIYRATEDIGAVEYAAGRRDYLATHKTMTRYRHNASILHRMLCELMTCDGLDAYAAAQAVESIIRIVGGRTEQESRDVARALAARLYAIAAETARPVAAR